MNPSGKRHDEIINEDIPDDLDVICLQEVFNEDAWKILNEKLRSKYPYILFDAHRVRVTNLKFSMVNSGLYIASKYPIVQSKFYPFKNSYAEDALSGKGKVKISVQLTSFNFRAFMRRDPDRRENKHNNRQYPLASSNRFFCQIQRDSRRTVQRNGRLHVRVW